MHHQECSSTTAGKTAKHMCSGQLDVTWPYGSTSAYSSPCAHFGYNGMMAYAYHCTEYAPRVLAEATGLRAITPILVQGCRTCAMEDSSRRRGNVPNG